MTMTTTIEIRALLAARADQVLRETGIRAVRSDENDSDAIDQERYTVFYRGDGFFAAVRLFFPTGYEIKLWSEDE